MRMEPDSWLVKEERNNRSKSNKIMHWKINSEFQKLRQIKSNSEKAFLLLLLKIWLSGFSLYFQAVPLYGLLSRQDRTQGKEEHAFSTPSPVCSSKEVPGACSLTFKCWWLCFTSLSLTSFLKCTLVSNCQSSSLLRCPTELANMSSPRCICCVNPHPDPHCPPTLTRSSLPVPAAMGYAGTQDPNPRAICGPSCSLLSSSRPAWLPFSIYSESEHLPWHSPGPLPGPTRTWHLAQTVVPASLWVPGFPSWVLTVSSLHSSGSDLPQVQVLFFF